MMIKPQSIRTQQGFTIIELVVVISLLGILSAVALPRFIDTGEDARKAVLEHIAAAMDVAAIETYSKAYILGIHTAEKSSRGNPPYIDFDGEGIELKYGYPEARADGGDGKDILDLIAFSSDLDVCYSSGCISGNSSRVKVGFDTTENDGCYVKYIEPDGTGNPDESRYKIIVMDTGC